MRSTREVGVGGGRGWGVGRGFQSADIVIHRDYIDEVALELIE